MTELSDTWNAVDLPVLREAVRICDADLDGGGARLGEISAAAGISEDDTFRSLRRLESDGLVEVAWMNPARAARVRGVSGEALRRVGMWPTPDVAYERLFERLKDLSESDDADQRSRAKKMLSALSGATRDFTIQLGAAVVGAQLDRCNEYL
jgi:DNA-binding Lrp family transcriptional regulator